MMLQCVNIHCTQKLVLFIHLCHLHKARKNTLCGGHIVLHVHACLLCSPTAYTIEPIFFKSRI